MGEHGIFPKKVNHKYFICLTVGNGNCMFVTEYLDFTYITQANLLLKKKKERKEKETCIYGVEGTPQMFFNVSNSEQRKLYDC